MMDQSSFYSYLESNGISFQYDTLINWHHNLSTDRVFGLADAWLYLETMKLARQTDGSKGNIRSAGFSCFHLLRVGQLGQGMTRVGGIPFPTDVETWPRNKSSQQLIPFIAQVDLRPLRSVSDLAPPVELVQVFGDPTGTMELSSTLCHREYEMIDRWTTPASPDVAPSVVLRGFEGIPLKVEQLCFAEAFKGPMTLRLPSGGECYLWGGAELFPYALRVGGSSRQFAPIELAPNERIIASIPSIIPSLGPYPFFDLVEPLDESSQAEFTVDLGAGLEEDYWSVVHVVLSDAGRGEIRLALE